LWEIVHQTEVKTMPHHLLKSADINRKRDQPGKHRDGAGLFLHVHKPGQASWGYKFRLNGKTLWGSIGPLSIYSLTQARDKHRDLRAIIHGGKDPRRAGAGEAAGASFETALTDYLREASPSPTAS
jgi:hypothetical protein